MSKDRQSDEQDAQQPQMARPQPIVIVTAGGPYAWTIANALAGRFADVTVMLEGPESKLHFLKRRARKTGWFSALGQFATMTLSRFAKRFAKRRESEIIAQFDLKTTPDPAMPVIHVASVNDAQAHAAIADIKPAAVFLAGCRMLSRATLNAMPCPVINYHAGITPKYRGMMGGYWAVAAGDPANYGSTVHLVDAGVDTGDILHQTFIKPDKRDTMLTHAMIQAAHSREIAIRAVEDALNGELAPKTLDLPSIQHFHPPIWSYLWTGLRKGVW